MFSPPTGISKRHFKRAQTQLWDKYYIWNQYAFDPLDSAIASLVSCKMSLNEEFVSHTR